MRSLSIHGIDDSVYQLLKTRAHNAGYSINQIIKELLEQSLGVAKKVSQPHRHQFEELCGTWSAKEKQQFDAAVSDFEKIDKADWQ